MKPQKYIKLLFVSLFMTSVLFSCKKQNKEETTVYFHLYNPVTNEGYSNVTVRIIEQKDVTPPLKLQSKYESKIIWEGKTDANGKASCSFKTFKSDKYTYWHSVDEDAIQVGGNKILTRAEYGPLQNEKINKIEYTYTVPALFMLQFKNVNCWDTNDRFKIRYRWMYNSNQFGWSNWSQDQFGCYDSGVSGKWNSYNDFFICQYEVERNGVLNTYIDTFYINPDYVDTLKIYY
ncbi:MAG: hypothetical protein M9916_00595 [Crocinitomicaceae bacterium]|nr:hypothetical protein [Crocinitomicaceae bacterium]